ncbi:MAG TPA: pitrilysin family protein [Spirochaetia bacterium]|nr:insulinase family protein [Spirochaetaceae bacterium]HPE88585.1 pitrilysin family protein [Spirochaetales bacterium]HRW25116.1 pitrilysin family protein [Spirochaetia bacterium]
MKRLIAIAAALLIAIAVPAFSEGTPIPGLHRYRLDNGLELFVLENHAVPLTRVQITFRCGSITQAPETAGLFHLYEHMLFKGNSKYRTETEFSAAMTDLGVAEWNGGTSTEYVTYYFTVPSDKTEAGLEFWSYAMREPLFDPAELSVEQDVVSNEINGFLGDPDRVYSAAMDKALFGAYPWRRDIGGNEAIVRSATVDTLRGIQSAYYVPNNAALFVGGDVDPEQVYAMAKAWYGSWERAADPWKDPAPAHPMPGVTEPVYLAYPDESLPAGIAYVEMRFRGPDVLTEPKPTFAADVWGYLIQAPEGRFKTGVFESVPALYNKDYLGGYYYTQRDGGQVSFYTYCFTDPSLPIADRAKTLFRDAVVDGQIKAMASDPSYFSDADFTIVKQKMEDEQIIDLETPEHFIETLSFWWSVASTEYFFDYVPSMKKVQRSDIGAFLGKFVLSNVPVIAVRLNPSDYDTEAGALKAAGFKTVSADNAFWWKDGE